MSKYLFPLIILLAGQAKALTLTREGVPLVIHESWLPSADFAYERIAVRHVRAEATRGTIWNVQLEGTSSEIRVLPEKAVAVREVGPGRLAFKLTEEPKHPLHLAVMDGERPVLYLFLDPAGYGQAGADAIDVRTLGIEANSENLQTLLINQAIADLSAKGGGTLRFLPGRYRTGTIHMRDGVFLHLDEGAVLEASLDLADFPLDPPGVEFLDLPKSLRPGVKTRFVLFDHVRNAGVRGRGVIDGQGSERRRLYKHPRHLMNLVRLVGCENIFIEGVTLKDSEFWSTHILLSKNIHFDGIKIYNEIPPPGWNPKNPSFVWNNADGINPDSSSHVTVEHSFFHTGDDCLPVKNTASFKGELRDVTDITVRACMMISPVTAMKIGTETLGSRIQRVLFEDIEVVSTSRVFGADLKDGVVAEDITLRDIRVFRCNRPLDLWILHREDSKTQDRFSNLRNVVIDRLHIRRAAIDDSGSECHIQGRDAEHTVSNVLLRDVRIAGKPILSAKDYPILTNEFLKDIRFEPATPTGLALLRGFHHRQRAVGECPPGYVRSCRSRCSKPRRH